MSVLSPEASRGTSNPSLRKATCRSSNDEPPRSPDRRRSLPWVTRTSPLVHLSSSIAADAHRQSTQGRVSVSVTNSGRWSGSGRGGSRAAAGRGATPRSVTRTRHAAARVRAEREMGIPDVTAAVASPAPCRDGKDRERCPQTAVRRVGAPWIGGPGAPATMVPSRAAARWRSGRAGTAGSAPRPGAGQGQAIVASSSVGPNPSSVFSQDQRPRVGGGDRQRLRHARRRALVGQHHGSRAALLAELDLVQERVAAPVRGERQVPVAAGRDGRGDPVRLGVQGAVEPGAGDDDGRSGGGERDRDVDDRGLDALAAEGEDEVAAAVRGRGGQRAVRRRWCSPAGRRPRRGTSPRCPAARRR